MTSVSTTAPPGEGLSPRGTVGVRLEVVASASDPGRRTSLSPREHRLAILAELGEGFGSAADPSELVDLVGRTLVEHLFDWSFVAPLESREHPGPVSLFVSPQARDLTFGPGSEPLDLELAPGGIVGRLPLSGPFRSSGEALHLAGVDGTVTLPTGEAGGAVLGGARLRYGGILWGRLPGRRRFDLEECDFIDRVVAKTSAALENVTVVRAARRAARVRDAVVEMVVHDLATPLNTLELAHDRIVGAGEASEVAAAVARYGPAARRAVDQIRSLLSDLGDLRDMEQGMFSAHLSSQPVCHILSAAVERVESLAAIRHVQVELDTGACPLQVMADPARTIQGLVNLLALAIEVTPAGESVLLVPRRAGDRAEIDVVDRGPGIPADRLPYLFDRYAWARGHDGSRRRLGLTIAQAIAVAHGEPLRVETEQGVGTRFTLSLALAPTARGEDGRGSGRSSPPSEARSTIE